MGFFEFFQWNKKEKSTITRKVSLDELTYEVEEVFKELENKSKIIKEEIIKRVSSMTHDLREQIKILKSINLEQRREDEKLKKIVKENLGFYISHSEKLINKIEETSNLEARESILKIQFILDNFYRKSFKNYEKATILIGKEIGQVKEIIKNFNKDFVKTVRENDFVFIKMKSVGEFRELNNKIKDLKIIKDEIENQIKKLQEPKGELDKQKSLLEGDYYQLKQDKEFKELLLQEQKFNEELTNLNEEILKIKEKINLKLLLKYYHADSKYNELLKSYKENFIETLENDEAFEIIKLVEEVHGINIKKEILDLKEKNRNLKTRDNHPAQTKLKIFEDKIKNIDLDSSILKEKEYKETKKFQRFNNKHASLIDDKINKAKVVIGDIEIINLDKSV